MARRAVRGLRQVGAWPRFVDTRPRLGAARPWCLIWVARPLLLVVLVAALLSPGAGLAPRPAHALSRFPPCEDGRFLGVQAINAQNSVQWTRSGMAVKFIHDEQVYEAAANGTRVQRAFEAPDEALIESVTYRKVYMTHADVSPDGTRVAYSVCWDSWGYGDDSESGPTTQGPRTVGVPIGVEFTEIAVWSEATESVEYPAVGSVPVWSPDGARIAFVSDHSYADASGAGQTGNRAEAGLYTMASDGSDIRLLAPTDDSYNSFPPRWSPDGARLAFVRHVGSVDQAVYTVRADGSDLEKVSSTASLPSWSPNGERLALALPDGEDVALFTVAADGSDAQRLTTIEGWQSQGWGSSEPTGAWVESVAWSPDGSKILYTCGWAVCVVDLDGNPVGTSPEDPTGAPAPAWSPDGSTIAVGRSTSSEDRSWGSDRVLYRMSPDGTDIQDLVREGLGLVAEHTIDDDLETRRAACTAGYVVSDPSARAGLVRDCQTLMQLRDGLFGRPVSNWGAGTPITQWVGLTAEGAPLRVTGLRVGGHAYYDSITGAIIPLELGNLSELRTLDLSSNGMSGTIPATLGHLARLETLDLGNNQLSGRIPAELGNLSNLLTLRLASNRLNGRIPRELGRLSSLKALSLHRNDLTGGIPEELGNLGSLQRLFLGENELEGPLPSELGGLANLQVLDVSMNGLSGSIPPEIGELSELQRLDLSGNDLSGDIPLDLGGLRELTELKLAENQLSGVIPWELGWLLRLQKLNLWENRLTGRVPVALGGIHSLRELRIWGNQLEECLPFHLARSPGLHIDMKEWPVCQAGVYAFNIRDDAVGGASVGTVVILGRQEVGANYRIEAGNEDGVFAIDPASGRISVADALDASEVERFVLTVEAVSGAAGPATVTIRVLPTPPLPATCTCGIAVKNPQEHPGLVDDCRTLLKMHQVLAGRLNWGAEAPMEQWEGIEIGGTPRRVRALEIQSGRGGGRLPPEIGSLTGLQRLVITNHELRGPIPAELGLLTELQELDLFANALSEAIPSELGQLTNLTRLSLELNRLTGPIPLELGQLTSLRELRLRANRLSGPIPAELGQLGNLGQLWLNYNQLTGLVPAEFGQLARLWELRLEHNELTPCLPESLAVRAREGVALPDWPTCEV